MVRTNPVTLVVKAVWYALTPLLLHADPMCCFVGRTTSLASDVMQQSMTSSIDSDALQSVFKLLQNADISDIDASVSFNAAALRTSMSAMGLNAIIPTYAHAAATIPSIGTGMPSAGQSTTNSQP